MVERTLIKHDGEETAAEFLAWFRTVRLEHKGVLGRHRFIVAGSIGIDAILRRLDASDKLNDFKRIYVGSLSPRRSRSSWPVTWRNPWGSPGTNCLPLSSCACSARTYRTSSTSSSPSSANWLRTRGGDFPQKTFTGFTGSGSWDRRASTTSSTTARA